MKRFVSLSASLLLMLSLLCGVFTVTALADIVEIPDEVEITWGEEYTYINFSATGSSDSMHLEFEDDGEFDIDLNMCRAFEENITGGNEKPQHSDDRNAYEFEGELGIYIPQDVFDACSEPGTTYTGSFAYSFGIGSGTITVYFTIPSEDSSEESSEVSSEPEDSSEPEESSEIEESSEFEESSAAEEESSAAESSKTSKKGNPGKPDTLTMGGGMATSSGDSKPAPDTGMSYAPLAALGVAAMAGLAIVVFKKK